MEDRSPTALSAATRCSVSPKVLRSRPARRGWTPRAWTEGHRPNLVYRNEVDHGGHFAALEQPRIFSEEPREAFRMPRS